MIVQLSTPDTDPECYNAQHQMDRQRDDGMMPTAIPTAMQYEWLKIKMVLNRHFCLTKEVELQAYANNLTHK